MTYNQFLEAALIYAKSGYKIFPCKPQGKKPLTLHGFNDATTDSNQIKKWWEQNPNANIGISAEGLIVIDVDPLKTGEQNPFLEQHKELLYTAKAIAKTGRGGYHFYYNRPEGSTIKCSTSRIAPNVDIRTDGGYVIAPPSQHENGNFYTWEEGLND